MNSEPRCCSNDDRECDDRQNERPSHSRLRRSPSSYATSYDNAAGGPMFGDRRRRHSRRRSELNGRITFHHLLEDDQRPKLRIVKTVAEYAVFDVLACPGLRRAIERRSAIEIGRIDAMRMIAVTIVAFESVAGSRDAPIRLIEVTFMLQGIHA